MNAVPPNPELLQIYRFVRGDMNPQEFELWIYANPQMKERLSPPLYLDVISVDFRDSGSVYEIRQRLHDWVSQAEVLSCQCITLANLAVVDMGGEDYIKVFATLEERVHRGEPFPWLSAYECSACGDWWLIGQESVQNDLYCMRRLHPNEVASIMSRQEWPHDFDRYEELLRIGKDAGGVSIRLLP